MPKISGVYKQNNNLYRASVSLGSDNLFNAQNVALKPKKTLKIGD